MKNLVILFFCTSLSLAQASAPRNYYNEVGSLTGYKLKSALTKIITNGHENQGYKKLYDIYFTSDTDTTFENDGSVLDIYSENPNSYDPYTYRTVSDRCGGYKGESDCFNREHLFPQSSFEKLAPMRSDFFHVFPTDGYVNNKRGSYPFGEVKNATWTSRNGSKLGPNTFDGHQGTVFEPIDTFKGDVARALLYFAVRYENKVKTFKHTTLNNTEDQVYKKWFILLLLKWHKQDPVSEHEIKRNEHGFKFQGNRNPFTDHPEYVDMIWGIGGVK
jgi:endonuclease I